MQNDCNHHHCVEEALAHAEQVCQASGGRLTSLRKRVLELIWDDHKPVKAYDLLTKLQKEDAAAKPSSVYRTLDFLFEQGLAHKIHRLNAYVGCKSPHKHLPGLFLICKKCEEVVESHDSQYYSNIDQIAAAKAFKIEEATFEIEGICEQCLKADSA